MASRLPWTQIEAALAPYFARRVRAGRVLEHDDLFGPSLQVAGAFACEGLLQGDARAFGGGYHLGARDLQQAGVHRVGNGLLLDGGVHDHALELGGLDRLGVRRSVDGGLQEFLDTGLAQGRADAPDLGGVAGQVRFVEGHAAEVLPHDVLGPAFDEFLIAELVGVLEVQQAGHEADGKARAT